MEKKSLEGIANRTDFDLGSHTKNQEEFKIKAKVMKNDKSTTKLAVHNLENKTWLIFLLLLSLLQVLIEEFLAILNEAYKEEIIDEKNSRIVLVFKTSFITN